MYDHVFTTLFSSILIGCDPHWLNLPRYYVCASSQSAGFFAEPVWVKRDCGFLPETWPQPCFMISNETRKARCPTIVLVGWMCGGLKNDQWLMWVTEYSHIVWSKCWPLDFRQHAHFLQLNWKMQLLCSCTQSHLEQEGGFFLFKIINLTFISNLLALSLENGQPPFCKQMPGHKASSVLLDKASDDVNFKGS